MKTYRNAFNDAGKNIKGRFLVLSDSKQNRFETVEDLFE